MIGVLEPDFFQTARGALTLTKNIFAKRNKGTKAQNWLLGDLCETLRLCVKPKKADSQIDAVSQTRRSMQVASTCSKLRISHLRHARLGLESIAGNIVY